MKLFLCVLLSMFAMGCPFSCGPSEAVPANPGSCPASPPVDGTPCGDMWSACYYTGPWRSCGAGASSTYTHQCSDRGQDAGSGVWLSMGCR